MEIKQLHDLFLKANQQITTDTRKITPDALFFALKGDHFNGNTFALNALEQGASYAIIDEAPTTKDPRCILVTDVLTTLQNLATYHRKYLNIPIISLTGSNGKTTTKELINAVLATRYKTTATIGNLNNHIGVPLTLLSMTPDTEIGIVEMGANHQKEIEALCNIALPNFGYITNFGKAHLEGFGGVEGIIKGKSEMYQYLSTTNGIAFVNSSLDKMVEKSANCNQFLINPSDYPLVAADPFVTIQVANETIQSNLIGNYNYTNILAAVAIGNYFKISTKEIKAAITQYVPNNNRSQIIKKENLEIILDAYNANPSSMMAALENFKNLSNPTKTCILGDMFELGAESALEHEKIVTEVLNTPYTYKIFIGNHFYQAKQEGAFFYQTFKDFTLAFPKFNFKKHLLLIKGSRGMALEKTLNLLES